MELECPITFNHFDQAKHVINSAKKVYKSSECIFEENISVQPTYVSEDFSYYTQKIKGAFIFLGTGGKAGLHESEFDFSDKAIEKMAKLWKQIVIDRC